MTELYDLCEHRFGHNENIVISVCQRSFQTTTCEILGFPRIYMSMNCVNSFKELLIVDDNELKPSLETKLSYFYWTTQYAPRTQVLILRSSNDRLPAITSYN